jgi:RNA polymerase sigma factor (sigma-70 family)
LLGDASHATEESRGEAALEALVRQYGRVVAAAVARVAGVRAASLEDDVAQQVFLGIWRRIQAEQTIGRPASYVYRAAVRETIRMLRRERAREEDPLEAAEVSPSASATAPDRLHDGKEAARAVEESLAALSPERERAVRAHLSGFTVEEVMGLYGWPYQKARNLIARGVADLRASLARKGVHV